MNGLRMPDGVTSQLTACQGGFLKSEQGQISKKSHDKQRERYEGSSGDSANGAKCHLLHA